MTAEAAVPRKLRTVRAMKAMQEAEMMTDITAMTMDMVRKETCTNNEIIRLVETTRVP